MILMAEILLFSVEMKSIAIFYFSGTGNTHMVVRMLEELLRSSENQIDLYRMEDFLALSYSSSDEVQKLIFEHDAIGFAYPVHAFNAPSLVFKFLQFLPSISIDYPSPYVFLIRTAGDPLCHGGSTQFVERKLAQKGFHLRLERLFIMPSNVFFAFNPRLIKQLFQIAQAHAQNLVQDILNEATDLSKNGWILNAVSWVFSTMESLGGKFAGHHFKISTECTKCGLCSRTCPTQNILFDGKEIKFKYRCNLCLRCVYRCPQHAISNGWLRALILKKGYDIRPILVDPEVQADFLTSKTKGFFKRYAIYAGLR